MQKQVTIQMDAELYNRFKQYAEMDNSSIPNFIISAAQRYIDSEPFVDDKVGAIIK